MTEYVVSLLSAFIGTIGFAIRFNMKKERLLYAALLGMITSVVYLLCKGQLGGDVFLSSLIPSITATVCAELSARWKKAPAIVFLLPAIIVLIPGSSLYYTMSHLVNGDRELFRQTGLQTVQAALGIAAGILLTTVFFYQTTRLIVLLQHVKSKTKK